MAFEKFDDVKVIDVLAFPNYADWVAPFIDPSLGYFAKTNWTQLQFTFERVGDTEGDRYPHFVKSTYQAYAQQEVIEIVDDPKKDVICPTGEKENITGLIPQLTRVTQRPLDTEEPLLILKSLPPKSHQITVDPFIKGSREIITDCCDRMINTYKDKNPAVARDWIKWRDEVTPKTNIATDYIAENPLHIPFFDVLFNGPTISEYEVGPKEKVSRKLKCGTTIPPMRVVESTSSVRHSGNKKGQPARRIVEDVDGNDVSDAGLTAKAQPDGPPRKKSVRKSKNTTSRKKTVPKKSLSTTPLLADDCNDSSDECGDDLTDLTEYLEDGGGVNFSELRFEVGQKVRTTHRLVATVQSVNRNGTYDIKYIQALHGTDEGVKQRFLKPCKGTSHVIVISVN